MRRGSPRAMSAPRVAGPAVGQAGSSVQASSDRSISSRPHEGDLRRFLLPKIGLLARAGHVVGAVDDRLHPPEPRVPRRADLLLGEGGRGSVTKASPPSCSCERAVARRARARSRPRTAHPRRSRSRRTRGAAPPDRSSARRRSPSSRPMRRYISRQKSATVSADVFRNRSITRPLHVVRELEQRPGLPVRGDALRVERRELPLELAGDREVQLRRLAGLAMAQDRPRLARIVVAVVAEEDDSPADLRLQPPGGLDLGDEEPPREKAAGLLAESDDRLRAHAARPTSLAGARTQDRLQRHAEGDARRAADQVVPEIADVRARSTSRSRAPAPSPPRRTPRCRPPAGGRTPPGRCPAGRRRRSSRGC